MHPILFRVPLPGWTIPLFPALLALGVAGVLLAVFGWRKRVGDLLLIGAVVGLGCAIAAFSFKGRSYTLSDLPIYSYGAMLCLSLVVGWFLTLRLAERDGLPRETMANCYFITALGALVGARLLYIATNPSEFSSLSDIVNIRRGGMVAYGGFLGGFVVSWLFLRSQRLRLLPWADVAVPSLASGLLITRLGCYLFGCDFGKPLSDAAPGWLKRLGTFPHWPDGTLADGAGSPAWIQHVNERGLSPDSAASLPVHPTQIYESLAGAALLGLVFFMRRRLRFRGEVFFAFTFAYGLLRFLIEILRDDLERGTFGPRLPEHVFYLLALLAFAAAFAYGPARAISKPTAQRISQAAAIVPGVVVFLWLKPSSFASPVLTELSTSQWIALLTAIGVAFGWQLKLRAAELHPEAAMSLGMDPVRADAEDEDEPGSRRSSEPEETGRSGKRDSSEKREEWSTERPAKRKKKRKRHQTIAETPRAKRVDTADEPESEPGEAAEKQADEPLKTEPADDPSEEPSRA